MKTLYRSKKNSWLGGVVGGIAAYFQFDPSLLRILIIIVALIFGLAGELLVVYMLAWILLPAQSCLSDDPPSDNRACSALKTSKGKTQELIGAVIIFIGVAILIKQFLPYQWLNINKHLIGASLLILAGLLILLKGRK
jgi:phage shock protein PspC (stress-responsive transcriptional regulator)